MDKTALFSHASDIWETPEKLFNDLDAIYHFDIDVCANEFNHKCPKYYSVLQDGLMQDWNGTVWCNPPYSNIRSWLIKAHREIAMDHCNTIVMLLPARTDVKWFHLYIYNRHNIEIQFIKGRLHFNNSKNSAPFPSMIIIFNKESEKGDDLRQKGISDEDHN